MCKKNLNATMVSCVSAEIDNPVATYSNVFDIVVPSVSEDGVAFIPKFDIVVNLSVVFSSSDENVKDSDVILKNKLYNCLVAYSLDQKIYKGIGRFSFCIDENKLDWFGGRSFYNATTLVKDVSINIPDNTAQCFLLLLISDEDNDKPILQTVKKLHINKA